MSGKSHYPAEVWAVIRELYESTPAKFSIKEIREKACELLSNEDLPSRESINRKVLDEKWEKQSHKQTRLETKKLKKRVGELIEITEECRKKGSNQEVSTIVNMEIDVKNAQLFKLINFEQRKSGQVILEHRQRSYKTGLFLDDVMGKLHQEMDKMLNFTDYYFENQEEFGQLNIAEAYDVVFRKYDKLLASVSAVESVGRATTALAKLDFVLYGLNPEDTREPESDKRITSLMSDEEYYKKKQELLSEEGERISKRMQMINSGQFEDEVKEQMIALANQDKLDDISDAEFDEVL